MSLATNVQVIGDNEDIS